MAPEKQKEEPLPNAKNLAQKILAVMRVVESVTKDKRNEHFNYGYASGEAIVTALRTAMIEQGMILSTTHKSCTEIIQKTDKGDQTLTKLEVEFTLEDADSGEKKSGPFYGYGADKGDKGLYKAMTGAQKYFLKETFLVPTPDDPEADKAKGAFNGQGKTYQPRAPQPPPTRPAAPAPARPAAPAAAAPKPPETNFGKPAAPASPAPEPAYPPPATAKAAANFGAKVERQVILATLQDVTKLPGKEGRQDMYKLRGKEGESWITFSETVAKNASDFAKKGVHLAIALDMYPRGPLVAGVKPA